MDTFAILKCDALGASRTGHAKGRQLLLDTSHNGIWTVDRATTSRRGCELGMRK